MARQGQGRRACSDIFLSGTEIHRDIVVLIRLRGVKTDRTEQIIILSGKDVGSVYGCRVDADILGPSEGIVLVYTAVVCCRFSDKLGGCSSLIVV